MNKVAIGLTSLGLFVLSTAAGPQKKKLDVPYVPTPDEVVAVMLQMADVGRDDVLYDLGCGDGRIVIKAAKERGCRGVGIDIDPLRIKESRENAIEAGVSDRVEFLLMDLFEADIHQATVVTLYLLSKINLRLRPKLLRELKPGTRVVSHDFGMEAWESDESAVIDGDHYDYPYIHEDFFGDYLWDMHRVFLWIVPANVTGVWEWTMPAASGRKRFRLELDQRFQKVGGKAYEGSSLIPLSIKDGKITGDRFEFALELDLRGRPEKVHFKGTVTGHAMEGLVTMEGQPVIRQKWRAKRIPSTVKPIAE